MKILLLANYLPDAQISMQRFAGMLQRGLAEQGHEVRVIRPEPVIGQFFSGPSIFKKWFGYIDKFLFFPPRLKKEMAWAEIVHVCDHSNAIYIPHLKKIPHVIACHDLIAIRSALGEFTEYQTGWSGQILQHLILSGLRKARYVICDSQATQEDLLRLKINPKNVSQIYLGLNDSYYPMSLTMAQDYLRSIRIPFKNPFALHVGGNDWYKNRSGVLEIFKILIQQKETKDLNLVFAGSELSGKLRKWIRKNHLEGRVFEAPKVSQKILCALYSTAEFLLYPSLAEGFGWPIIEAQACGCPVVTSNRAPMTEVAGKAAIYVNPNSFEEAAWEIAKNIHRSEELRQKGFANLERFSTRRMIEDYLKIYKEILN